MFCLGTQVEDDSKVSTKLCVKCFKKTIEFYDFKTQALKSEACLKSVDPNTLSQIKDGGVPTDNIKTEIESVDIDDVVDNGFESDARCELEMEIKDEPKTEYRSEDEFLSLKPIKIKIPRSKQDLKAGPMKVCEECGKYVRDLKSHALTHIPLENRKKAKCEICDKLFATAQSKYKHKRRKHFGMKKECPICHKMVLNLSVHQKMHNPEEFKFECAPCGRRFVTKSRLDIHVSVHTKDRPFECNICHAKFRLKLCMNLHIRRVHDKEKSHLCQYCSKSFFKKHHLQLHLSTCGKCFGSRTIMKNHILIHTNDKKYACSLCDMSFVRR
ncbi:putative Zn finger protein, partial [Operophtera brumata]